MKRPQDLRTRREFLRGTMLGGALSWTVPAFVSQTFTMLHQAAAGQSQPDTGRDRTVLVLVQMAGGNDGLNTVIPYGNDHYAKARPKLRLAGPDVIRMDAELGLHPALAGMQSLYDEGALAVVQGVGYPNPNRSHFRSTEIWQTASDARTVARHGWLGRYFDHACAGADPTVGINVGRQSPQAFAARQPTGVSLENPESYRYLDSDVPGPGERAMSEQSYRKLNEAEDWEPGAGDSIGSLAGSAAFDGPVLDFLERTALDAQVSSDLIRSVGRRARNAAAYPAGRLGNALALVARLIGGGLTSRVYYVSQGGYDTHTNQAGAHQTLLRELGDSIRAFHTDLKAQGNQDRVLLMTFSEFGRRVEENGSGGTDHGAASVLFLTGGAVRPGLLGRYPSLAPSDLHRGDLKFTVDFRSVYAALLEGWLGAESVPVLGRAHPPLPCLKS